MTRITPDDRDDSNLVDEGDACPTCGERIMDLLLWDDDGRVVCQMCRTAYQPAAQTD